MGYEIERNTGLRDTEYLRRRKLEGRLSAWECMDARKAAGAVQHGNVCVVPDALMDLLC
jgi:hypothetical protein